jgi:hypothetical protein
VTTAKGDYMAGAQAGKHTVPGPECHARTDLGKQGHGDSKTGVWGEVICE